MTDCTRINISGDDLDRFSDDQFEEFLEHAAFCRVCDEILMKYEDNFLPILREALSNEIPIPVTVTPPRALTWPERAKDRCVKIFNTPLSGLVPEKLVLLAKGILRPVYRFVQVQVTTLTLVLVTLGGLLMGWRTVEENYQAPLTHDELESMNEAVRVDTPVQTTGDSSLNTDVPAADPEIVPPPVLPVPPSNLAIKNSGGQTSVVLDSMDVDPGAQLAADYRETTKKADDHEDRQHPDRSADDNDRKKDRKVVYGILNIRVIAEEGDPVLCTARKQFGDTRFTISQTTYNGVCRWEGQELNQNYVITAKSTKTEVRKEFIVVASSDDTCVTEIRLKD